MQYCHLARTSDWKLCEWKLQYERSQQTCAIWNSFIRPPIIKLNHCWNAQAFVHRLYISIEQEWFADGPTLIYIVLVRSNQDKGKSTITNVISQQQCLCCWWQWWEWWCSRDGCSPIMTRFAWSPHTGGTGANKWQAGELIFLRLLLVIYHPITRNAVTKSLTNFWVAIFFDSPATSYCCLMSG